MAPRHLVAYCLDDIVEAKMSCLFGHARVEHDLQQQVAEFVAQPGEVAAIDRIGDFVGFLDRVRNDGLETLRAIPVASVLGMAQGGHDVEEAV